MRVATQATFDFSDIFLDASGDDEMKHIRDQALTIDTVDERFDSAVRKTEENRLQRGSMSMEEKRRLLDVTLRRPDCSRPPRSWRTENSDFWRGDNVPQHPTIWGVTLTGANTIDMRRGAQNEHPMSNSEVILLSNEVDDDFMTEG